jgi:fumarate reductase flavoprotein subunit
MQKKDEVEEKGINRRDFIKGSVIATGAGIIAGCAPKVVPSAQPVESNPTTQPADPNAPQPAVTNNPTQPSADEPWYGTAPEIADADIEETVDTEILICGAGHAGLTAAMAASEKGAKVVVLEKNPSPALYKMYLGAIDSAAQIAAGVKIDKNEVVNEMVRYGSGHVNQKLIRVWADESGKTLDWLAGILAEFGAMHVAETDNGTGYHGIFKVFPIHTRFVDAKLKYPETNKILVEKATKSGAQFMFSTPMVKLIREDDNKGKVIGAIAKKADGKYLKITASKGVLLATGGYANDNDLFTKLNPEAAAVTTVDTSWTGNKGDGIKAGIWVGGVKDKVSTAMLFDRGSSLPGTHGGMPYMVGMNYNYNFGSQPFLKVNLNGERFCNESAPYDWPIYASAKEGPGTYCMIWDANYWNQVESFHTVGCSRLVPSNANPKTGEGIGKDATDAMIQANIKLGNTQTADTIEELAGKLKIPTDALKATITRYNQLAASGVDDDFGKTKTDLLPIDTAPFYGVTLGGTVLCTLDGLLINPDMQVLDVNYNVIEGLYAAGDVSGGYFSNNYPELMVGCASGRSMTFGRHAVLHMLGA